MKSLPTLLILLLLTHVIHAQYQSPESAIWDNVNKRYFISNAGSGTIATVDWSGRTENAWTSGLIQPKAMIIIDSTLFVLDYTTMKSYNVNTGILIKNETVPTATFMNDMCMDNENNFYITETYDNSIIKYDWKRKTYSKPALKGFIEKPNGIIFDGNRLLIVSYRENAPIQAISLPDYVVTTVLETDIDFMDGLAKDGKGNVFFSAWIDQNTGSGKVYRMKDDFSGKIEDVITNLDGPADIYYNRLNDTLVVPNMSGSWVGFYPFIDAPPVPLLVNPAAGDYLTEFVSLKWTKTRAAQTYTLETSYNADFNDATSIQQLKDTIFSMKVTNECDTMFWRVKAVNTVGESDWSEYSFLIPRQPIATEQVKPMNNEVDVSIYPDFIWKQRESSYKLMIDTEPNFTSADLIVIETSDTSYSKLTLKSNTTYYWAVRVVHCDNEVAGDTFSFKTIDATLPAMAELKFPIDNSTDNRVDSIEFKWTNTSYTDYYRFYLSDRDDFKTIIKTDSIPYQSEPSDISYFLKQTLNCDGIYFWTVHSFNQFGFTKSETNMFETIPCLSVDQMSNANEINIYPNPGSGNFKVQFDEDIVGNLTIELRNSMGMIYPVNIIISESSVSVSTINQLPTGIYLLRISNGGKTFTGKIIIVI